MCNREAPEVEQFARDHASGITVVGLGSQDTLEEAEEFHADHFISFTLLWDPGFASWQYFGITSQPNAILFDPDGRELARYSGALGDSEYADIIATAQG